MSIAMLLITNPLPLQQRLFQGYLSRGQHSVFPNPHVHHLERHHQISTPSLGSEMYLGVNGAEGGLLGVRANRVRKLRRRCRSRREACRTSLVGYGGPRRLRSPPPSIVPRFPRYPHLLRG